MENGNKTHPVSDKVELSLMVDKGKSPHAFYALLNEHAMIIGMGLFNWKWYCFCIILSCKHNYHQDPVTEIWMDQTTISDNTWVEILLKFVQ